MQQLLTVAAELSAVTELDEVVSEIAPQLSDGPPLAPEREEGEDNQQAGGDGGRIVDICPQEQRGYDGNADTTGDEVTTTAEEEAAAKEAELLAQGTALYGAGWEEMLAPALQALSAIVEGGDTLCSLQPPPEGVRYEVALPPQEFGVMFDEAERTPSGGGGSFTL